MTTRQILAGAIGLLVVIAIAAWFVGARRVGDTQLVSVTRSDVTLTVPGRARLVPKTTLVLASQEGGTLQRLHRRPGEAVIAGDVIASISSPTLLAELARAKRERDTALAEYETRIAQIVADDGKARIEHSRALHAERVADIQYRAEQSLFERGVSGEIAVQKARAEFEQKVAEREFAAAQLAERTKVSAAERMAALRKREIAEAAATDAAAKVDALAVRAPVAGVLGAIKLKEGSGVTAGAEITTVNSPELAIEIDVAEAAVVDVAVGQAVRVSSRSFAVNARIVSMDAVADNGLVVVRAESEEPIPSAVRANTTAEATITTGSLAGALTVKRPPGALPRTAGTVYRVERGGALARRVRVEFGPLAGDRIVVTKGLDAGDQVALVDSFLPAVDL